jgi:hypothetical protein
MFLHGIALALIKVLSEAKRFATNIAFCKFREKNVSKFLKLSSIIKLGGYHTKKTLS